MNWFSKNKKEERGREDFSSLPELPRLPELPSINDFDSGDSKEPLPQLPTYPTSSLGERFSRNAIKDAVTGKKKGDEVFDADDFAPHENMRMMRKPLKKSMTREIQPFDEEEDDEFEDDGSLDEYPSNFHERSYEEEPEERFKPKLHGSKKDMLQHMKHADTVFIRIDKFEDSLKAFENSKKKISEIEKMLHEIKKIKEEEEKELESWENEIQSIKGKFEKIDRDLFSKIE